MKHLRAHRSDSVEGYIWTSKPWTIAQSILLASICAVCVSFQAKAELPRAGYSEHSWYLPDGASRDLDELRVPASSVLLIHQPSPRASARIRIHGNAPVQLEGRLYADGQLELEFESGLEISSGAELHASALDIVVPSATLRNQGLIEVTGQFIHMRAEDIQQEGAVVLRCPERQPGELCFEAKRELVLRSNSKIEASAQGGPSTDGGKVLLKAGVQFEDEAGSIVSIRGSALGGDGGSVEVSAPRIYNLHTHIDGHAARGFTGGSLLIDPANIFLADFGDAISPSGTVNPGDPPDTLNLDVSSINNLITQNQLSKITLQATSDIELSTFWTVPDSQAPSASLSLQAGRNIKFDDGSGIQAGRNWSVNMTAGTNLNSAADRQSGADGIYLQGTSFIHTLNGDVALWAGNEVLIDDGRSGLDPTGNGIATAGGGSIDVKAKYGDVNTGGNPWGYNFNLQQPYYTVSPQLGGVSTAAGGNVTISAGGDVRSYLPLNGDPQARFSGGSGAFGSEPGNVTISAQGSVYGHYVLGNGTGTIVAGYNPNDGSLTVDTHQNIGGHGTGQGVALSLASGNWNLSAPKGSIFLQEIRNPNGVLNGAGGPASPGYHLFDYSAAAAVLLDAYDSVEITGLGAPRPNPSVPIIFPPSLSVTAGKGGVVLDTSLILYPSPVGNLTIVTTNGGSLVGTPDPAGGKPTLLMSDSGGQQWLSPISFSQTDHAKNPLHLNDPNQAKITIAGDVQTLGLFVTKPTDANVGRDIINSGFVGENLHPGDVTSINVAGQIFNRSAYTFQTLAKPIQTANPYNPLDTWDAVFRLAVDPQQVRQLTVPTNATSDDLRTLAASIPLFPEGASSFVYDPMTLRFGISGPMSQAVRAALEGLLEVIQLAPDGVPLVDPDHHFVTTPVTFVDPVVIESLYHASQDVPALPPIGYQIGGPGNFRISAGSMDLGNTSGILSWGVAGPLFDTMRYSALAGTITSGAEIEVNLQGDLNMLTSAIASFFGGDVRVNSFLGGLNLGSPELSGTGRFAFGIYTSGYSDVYVTASKDININGSRIAAYNDGNIHVQSLGGNVNVGSGGTIYVNVPFVSFDEQTGTVQTTEHEIYGSGVVAVSPPMQWLAHGAAGVPGNITIESPLGNIVATMAGILQLALDGSSFCGPTITLVAGSPGFGGEIDLGVSGAIGGSINITANGSVLGGPVTNSCSTFTETDLFVAAGTPVHLSSLVRLVPPLTYQWYKGGAVIDGATQSTLDLSPLSRRDSALYMLVMTHSQEAVTNTFLVRVSVPEHIGLPKLENNGVVRFFFGDLDGTPLTEGDVSHFFVQTSTNLSDWVTASLSIQTNAAGGLQFDDTPDSRSPVFYRVVEH